MNSWIELFEKWLRLNAVIEKYRKRKYKTEENNGLQI